MMHPAPIFKHSHRAARARRRVLCAGHSLGAAMAVLCGPWARSKFPNVWPPPVLDPVFRPAGLRAML